MPQSESKKVISRNNLPAQSPVSAIILMYLFLDRLHAAQWVWGAVGVIYLLIVANIIYHWVDDKEVDLFKNTKP